MREWTEGKVEGLKAAIITTASPKKAGDPFAVKTREDFLEMNIGQVDFMDIEFEDPVRLLDYNVFYICGGNPYHLLHALKASGADDIFRRLIGQETLLVGVSAGTMIFGPHIEIADHFTPEMNTAGLKDLTALDIYKKPLFPHYGREGKFKDASNKTIEERIAAFEAASGDKVERLSDNKVLIIKR